MGVEEELLLAESGNGQPRAVAGTVLAAVRRAAAAPGPGRSAAAGPAAKVLEFELQLQQLETNTWPCGLTSLTASCAGAVLPRLRPRPRAGAVVAALATSPVAVEPELVGKGRYRQMARAFGLTAYEQLTCGCHVYVGVSSEEEGVAALDRIGPWLAVLLALSANSPFWQGRDSTYASFRYQVPGPWPTAGLRMCSAPRWPTSKHWRRWSAPARCWTPRWCTSTHACPSATPTVEIRIADVCLRADDAVLIAALARVPVDTEARGWRQGVAPLRWRGEPLRLAAWRASRSGLSDVLLSPLTGLPEPAAAVADTLLGHVSGALAVTGDTATVGELLAAVLARGNGAVFQRNAYRHSQDLPLVIQSATAATMR